MRCGPSSVRPAAASRARFSRSTAITILDRERGLGEQRAVPSSRQGRSPPRKRRASSSRALSAAADAARSRRARGDRDGEFGGFMLDRIEPMAVGSADPRAAGCASAGAVERGDAGAVAGSTASTSRSRNGGARTPAGEQAVHRRHQPEHTQMIGKGGGRGRQARDRRGTGADGASPVSPCGGSMPVPSVARPSAPSISTETAQRPSPSLNAISSRWRGAGRVRASGTRSLRARWSCRRRSARPARTSAPSHDLARRGSCGSSTGVRRRDVDRAHRRHVCRM